MVNVHTREAHFYHGNLAVSHLSNVLCWTAYPKRLFNTTYSLHVKVVSSKDIIVENNLTIFIKKFYYASVVKRLSTVVCKTTIPLVRIQSGAYQMVMGFDSPSRFANDPGMVGARLAAIYLYYE